MEKGFLFSMDLILAFGLIIFVLGSLFVYSNYKTNQITDMKTNLGINTQIDIIFNNIADGNANCDLIGKNNKVIKKVSFCLARSKLKDFGKDITLRDFNFAIKNLKDSSFLYNSVPTNNYIAKDINILLVDKNISKEKYFHCTEGNCDINTEVRIYVWKK